MTLATTLVENFLHFRIGREKSANDAEHFVQRGGVGAEKAEEMPEEEKTGGERKEELVGHLGRKAERLVGRSLPDEATHDSAGKSEKFSSSREVYFAASGIAIKLSADILA
jgi:hypothetical protein